MDCFINKQLRLLLCLVVLILPNYVAAKTCDSIRFNGLSDWYPVFYRENGAAKGIAYQLLNHYAKYNRLGLQLQEPRPLKRMLIELQRGHIDLVAGSINNALLANQFLVSKPIASVKLSVFTRVTKKIRFNQPEDLRGLVGAKLLGMSLGEALDSFARNNLVIEEAVDLQALFKMLEYGRVDYVVMYEEAALAFIRERALQTKIAPLEKALGYESVHFLASPRSHCIKKLARFFEGELKQVSSSEGMMPDAQSSEDRP